MPVDDHEVVALFLEGRRSEGTRSEYRRDLQAFLGKDASRDEVEAFLTAKPREIIRRLAQWKAELIARPVSEATLNRYLASLRSFLHFAYRMERSTIDGRGTVDGERVEGYRDTRGIGVEQMRKLLRLPGEGLLGSRDRAMLRVLLENGLRRNELATLDVEHFDREKREIRVKGKGKGTQRVLMRLSPAAAEAIQSYLDASGHQVGALFRNARGERLTTDGLYFLIREYGNQLGVSLSPHKLRHSCITAALNMTNDVRAVQRLSRHANLSILAKYDDNRRDQAGEVSEGLSGLLGS
jgi:integrase/recombinase XerC